MEDQLDVVLEDSEFETRDKFDPTKSVTVKVKDPMNEMEIIKDGSDELDTGNVEWKEVNFTGKVLNDNIFLEFKNKLQSTIKVDFFGIKGVEAGM